MNLLFFVLVLLFISEVSLAVESVVLSDSQKRDVTQAWSVVGVISESGNEDTKTGIAVLKDNVTKKTYTVKIGEGLPHRADLIINKIERNHVVVSDGKAEYTLAYSMEQRQDDSGYEPLINEDYGKYFTLPVEAENPYDPTLAQYRPTRIPMPYRPYGMKNFTGDRWGEIVRREKLERLAAEEEPTSEEDRPTYGRREDYSVYYQDFVNQRLRPKEVPDNNDEQMQGHEDDPISHESMAGEGAPLGYEVDDNSGSEFPEEY